jgi:L-amino acid N-acyltransferase YncA
MNAAFNPNDLRARLAKLEDATAIATIYNQGIEDRVATFETKMRTAADITAWFDGVHPVVVVEAVGRMVAFASTSTYRPRDCYAGIAEVSLYVERAFRGQGAGRLAMQAIIHEAEKAGFWKLLSRVFLDNQPSRKLIAAAGFRKVGIYKNHGKLDGVWRDVLIVERLIPTNLR